MKTSTGLETAAVLQVAAPIAAAEIAGRREIDNRVMHPIGRAALEFGLLGSKAKVAPGIPSRANGNSPFSDS